MSHLQKIIPLVLFLMLYSSTVFAQSYNPSSVFTDNSNTVCVYVLNGHLMYGSNSCKTEGAATILSQAKGITPDVFAYLVNTDKVLYVVMLSHYRCHECNMDVSKLCSYDYSGNLIPSFSDDQKNVLLDLQANYSFIICPFTEKPSVSLAQPSTTSSNIPDPLEQLKSGVPAKNVKCQQGLDLVIKAEDGTPACVTPDGAIKLAQRGWALSQDVMKENMTYHHNDMYGVTTIDLKDQASCQEAPLSGTWFASNSTCVMTDLTLTGDSLIVDDSVFPSITLTVTGTINNLHGSITNNGTIDTNNGTIDNSGIFTNNKGHIINANQEGSLNTGDQGSINNNGIFTNNGTINTEGSGTINANGIGIFTNYGSIDNAGDIENNGVFNTKGTVTNFGAGVINNYGGGTITNYAESMIANSNAITNYGTVTNYGTTNNTGTITNFVGGTIINKEIFDNNGAIANNGAISNNGTINNKGSITEYCGSTNTGNPVVGSAYIISSCS
ncbi:MAG: hypothetical protein WCC52_01930 [Nitrosotalea sp.]